MLRFQPPTSQQGMLQNGTRSHLIEIESDDQDVSDSLEISNTRPTLVGHSVRSSKGTRLFSRERRPAVRQDGHRFFFDTIGWVTMNRENHETTTVSISLPKWLCDRHYEFCLVKSYQGWDQSFRSYRTVSYNSPVFQYSMQDDVASLQRLFEAGNSSPFEVDPDGRTPLHVRIFR
jgi:hypothetical protein